MRSSSTHATERARRALAAAALIAIAIAAPRAEAQDAASAEALWRRAAFLMQPPIMSSFPSPFSGTSPPSQAMVIYAALYAAAALGLAMRVFSRRDL